MTISKTVQRLLRVLDLEEELRRRELESARAEMAQLDAALKMAGERERDGRMLFTASVRSEDLRDRLAGQAEVHAGRRRGEVLQRYIQRSTRVVEELRAALLEKRVERKQAETLVQTAEARESLEVNRRTQQSLDAWHLMRLSGDRSDAKRNEHDSACKPVPDDRP